MLWESAYSETGEPWSVITDTVNKFATYKQREICVILKQLSVEITLH